MAVSRAAGTRKASTYDGNTRPEARKRSILPKRDGAARPFPSLLPRMSWLYWLWYGRVDAYVRYKSRTPS